MITDNMGELSSHLAMRRLNKLKQTKMKFKKNAEHKLKRPHAYCMVSSMRDGL